MGAVYSGAPPVAGPASAQAGAAAAEVVRAAARTGGDPAVAAQADALRARLVRLADDDALALAAARAALPDAPAGGDERRDYALGRALAHAADVPLAIAEACADVAGLARAFAAAADPALAADLEASALLAAGAARAAAHLVEVNLLVGPDDPRAVRARAAVARAEEAV